MAIDPRRIEVMDKKVAEIMRRMTPWEKIAKVDEFWEMGRSIIGGALRQEHPEWADEQINREVVRRMTRGSSD